MLRILIKEYMTTNTITIDYLFLYMSRFIISIIHHGQKQSKSVGFGFLQFIHFVLTDKPMH
jgi:hypothetical protein